MADRDAAFLWETEALRGSRSRGEVADRPAPAPLADTAWATLREAHYQTGIPIETLRKWARRGAVASFLDESDIGVRRMVKMEAVRARAAELGRPIAPVPRPPANVPSAPAPAPAQTPDEPTPPRAPALTAPQRDAVPTEAEPETAAATDSAEPPDGTMIVPVAAWDKMLMQLGNLHEAGQQLAEARERAAKAETEATFLRERLGEMRRELANARAEPTSAAETAAPPPPPDPDPETAADPEPEPAPQQSEKLWRYIYRGWRARRK